MAASQATVIREGRKQRINSREVVPGDVIVFESGDRIPADARTVAFTTIVMLEMVRVAMIRSQYGLSFFSNGYLIDAILLSILLQTAVVYVPVMNIIFKTCPLLPNHWGFIIGMMAAMYVVGTQITKRIGR